MIAIKVFVPFRSQRVQMLLLWLSVYLGRLCHTKWDFIYFIWTYGTVQKFYGRHEETL